MHMHTEHRHISQRARKNAVLPPLPIAANKLIICRLRTFTIVIYFVYDLLKQRYKEVSEKTKFTLVFCCARKTFVKINEE